MGKRDRLKVIHDVLLTIREHDNRIKPTRLLHRSNLSPQMFKEYMQELLKKEFVVELVEGSTRAYALTEKGFQYLEQYKVIVKFIDDFGI